MIQPMIYFFTYLFEQIVSYIFFNTKYKHKIPLKFIILCYVCSGLVQFSISFIGIPNLNSLSFLILNLVIALICFNLSVKQAIWSSLLLTMMMILSEMVVIFIFAIPLNLQVSEITNQANVMIFTTLGSKALYFFLTIISSRISFKENRYTRHSVLYVFLCLSPLSSILILWIFTIFSLEGTLSLWQSSSLTIVSILLLLSNAIVFLVQEQMTRIQQENFELRLEQQKERINQEHYEQLEKQYENSAILVHDTERCLSTIAELAIQSDENAILKYIHSFMETNQVKGLRIYSNNKLVNVIVTRYCELCREKHINTNIDIRNIDFSFLTDGDLTAILDNLLENAYEAAQKVKKGEINLQIDAFNENFLLIKIQNSCQIPPKIKDGHIITSKKSDGHGYGLKSVRRAAERYNGEIKFSYDKDHQLFQVSTYLQRPNKKIVS